MDHVTLVMPLPGTVVRPKANNWYSLQAHKIWWRYFRIHFIGCEILNLVTWSWPRPLRGQLVTWWLVLLVAKPCTKFEVGSFSRSKGISRAVQF